MTPWSPSPAWVPDRQFSTLMVVVIAITYAWVVLPTGLQWSLTLEAPAAEAGVGPWFKVQWVPLYAIALWLLLRRFQLTTVLLPEINPFLLMILGWMFVSALWAPDPGRTVRQSVIIFGTLLIAVAQVTTAWQPGRLEAALRWTLTGLCVVSALVAVAMPSIGVHQEEMFELKNSWRGVTMTKFYLGHISEFSALLWGHALLTRQVSARAAWLGIVFSVFVLIKSRCNTSMLVLMIGLGIMLMLLRPPLRLGRLRLPAILVLSLMVLAPLLGYLMFVGGLSYEAIMRPVAESFGKDITISGRTHIWAELWRSISASSANFWHGVGFMSFWNGPGSLANDAYIRIKWSAPDGHNGYLDVWNELGLIGLSLLLLFLLQHARQLGRIARIAPETHALHLAIFVMVLIENLTNSGFFRPNSAPYLLMAYSSLTLSRLLLEQKFSALSAGASRQHATAKAG